MRILTLKMPPLRLLLGTLLLAACSLGGPSRPAHFYALSVNTAGPAEAAAPSPMIGVGPVSLPEIYDRPQIVTRPDANRVELAEYDRWSGSLGEDLQRVLVQNLAGRLNNDNIVGWPWQRQATPVLQVAVQFFRFDGDVGKQAYLAGVWQLFNVAAGCRLEVHRFAVTRAPDGPGYAAYVGALSLALAQLSDEIAGRLAGAGPGCQRGTGPDAR